MAHFYYVVYFLFDYVCVDGFGCGLMHMSAGACGSRKKNPVALDLK